MPAAPTDFSALLPMLVVAVLVLAGVAAVWWRPRWQARRHARLRAQPFPAAWRRILRHRVPLVARLPADLQQRLKGHIQVFLADKPFIGCQGQVVDDEVRVTIAAQACLLLLGEAAPPMYPRLREVLVYPGVFVVDALQPQAGGVVHEQRQALSGQSWAEGRVVLAWNEVLAGAADAGDGQNVVVHEFAHQIDQDKGVADGQPWRPLRRQRRQWARVMGQAHAQLQQQPSAVINPYAATSPAEYFAVVSELFFEQPQALAHEAPEVYRELAGLYQVHPALW